MSKNFFINKYKKFKIDKNENINKIKSPGKTPGEKIKSPGKKEKIYFNKLEVKVKSKQAGKLKANKKFSEPPKKHTICLYLIFIGIEKASAIIKSFNEHEAEKIAKELLTIKSLTKHELKEVEAKFGKINIPNINLIKFGKNYTRELLQKAFGIEKGSKIFINASGGEGKFSRTLNFMNQLSPKSISEMLSKESDSIIAIILSMMNPKTTAEVLRIFPKEKCAGLIKKMSQRLEINPETEEAIIEKLRKKSKDVFKNEMTDFKGKDKLVEILKNSSLDKSISIIEELEKDLPELAEEIKNGLFTFDDIINISRKNLSMVLRDFKDKDIAYMLKGANHEISNVVFNAISKKRKEMIKEEIDYLGTVKKTDVAEKQKEFIDYMIDLEQRGKINIKRDDEIYVE